MIAASAFVVNQIVLIYLRSESDNSDEVQIQVFLYFATLTRALVTTFEMTLGNWGPPAWLLINNVNEAWGAYVIFYKCTAGFAILNVINAVFLRLTMREADTLDNIAIQQAKNDATKYHEKVGILFDVLDTSGDEKLSYEEFQLICESASLRAWMNLLSVSPHDVQSLFWALDDGDGFVTKKEFLDGFCKLSGGATAVDAIKIKAMIRQLSSRIGELMK